MAVVNLFIPAHSAEQNVSDCVSFWELFAGLGRTLGKGVCNEG